MLHPGIARSYRCAALPASCRQLVVLPSSCFQHIIDDVGDTTAAFASDQLSITSPYRRGHLLEDLANRVLERLHPGCCVQDPPASATSSTGQPGGKGKADWDGTFQGRRLEFKTAQLSYQRSRSRWQLAFHDVKFARDGRASQPFDDLYLLAYAPDGFYLLKHDLATGITSCGGRNATRGHRISVSSHTGQSWREAMCTILAKLMSTGTCKLLAIISKADPLVQAMYCRLSGLNCSLASTVYEGIPWSTMSPALRAHRVERIGVELDQLLNPRSAFSTAAGEVTSRGCRRGVSNAAVDWVRDSTRVEVKSAKMMFDVRQPRWVCYFSKIKLPGCGDSCSIYFDELWLAVYSPLGIHFFKHWGWRDRLYGKRRLAVEGTALSVCGRRNDLDFRSALKDMRGNLEAAGAELHAVVLWER